MSNLFEVDPGESLFGDPRTDFERLRSAVMAYRHSRGDVRPLARPAGHPASPEETCDAVAGLLLVFLDRQIGDGKNGPACNSPSLVELIVDRVIKAITGHYLVPEEVFRD